jgi:hypothetical protein
VGRHETRKEFRGGKAAGVAINPQAGETQKHKSHVTYEHKATFDPGRRSDPLLNRVMTLENGKKGLVGCGCCQGRLASDPRPIG